jgi:hypothetical protein
LLFVCCRPSVVFLIFEIVGQPGPNDQWKNENRKTNWASAASLVRSFVSNRRDERPDDVRQKRDDEERPQNKGE